MLSVRYSYSFSRIHSNVLFYCSQCADVRWSPWENLVHRHCHWATQEGISIFFPLHLEQLSFFVYLKFTLHMAIETELVLFSHSVHTAHCPSADSEKAARPETDCGLCHSGCQGDCIIKMNRYAWLVKREMTKTDEGRSWCQVRSQCSDMPRLTQWGHESAQH